MQRPLKVAHVCTVDSSLRYLLLNQLVSLGEAGFEVVGVSSDGPDVVTVQAAGIRHIAVPMTRSIAPLADLVSLLQLWRTIRRERFSIVHTHNPKPGLVGQLAAKLAGVPVIVNTVHGFHFHSHMSPALRRFYISLEKVSARCSDVILSQSAEDIDTAIRERICDPKKIKYLGNGIDLSEFDPGRFTAAERSAVRASLGVPKTARVVGFVGRLAARRKGFEDFLRAARIVSDRMPDARFLIVGAADAGMDDTVDPDKAAALGIADRCVFLGWRPSSELPALYSVMDVLVLPSLFEGIPRGLMEACAMGIPIVATDVKGNREVVEHSRNGLLVQYGDYASIADATTRLLADPEEARAMGAEGRRIALKRFDERVVFERVEAEYARLLRQKRLAK